MASRIYLDTHVVTWLFAGRTALLSKRARRAITQGPLFVSPMVLLEIDFLREIDRVDESGERMVRDLAGRLGLRISDTDFRDVIAASSGQSWTLDPFDRIIVGEASLERSRLVTKDGTIRDHYSRALW